MSKIMGRDIVTESTGDADIAVASTAVIYTQSINIAYAEYFKLTYKATSTIGTPDIKIEMECGDVPPTTEGSADTDHYVEPENASDIEASLTTETIHEKAINPPASKYIRFKITGNASNPADTVVNMWLTKQES